MQYTGLFSLPVTPDSLDRERIGDKIFDGNRGVFVICNPKTTAFEYCKKSNILTSIFSEKDAGKINLGGFDKSYVIPDKYTGIDDHAFEGVEKLEEITIPANVKTIGEYAFVGLKLKKVQFTNGLTKIGDFAFADCCDIETITLPNSVKEIGSGAFSGCEKLKEVHLSNSLISLSSKAFSRCHELAKIALPDSLQKIEKDVFYNTNILVICNPETVAYNYCLENNIRMTSDVKTIEESLKQANIIKEEQARESLKTQEQEKTKKDFKVADGIGCLIWRIAIYYLLKWIFF